MECSIASSCNDAEIRKILNNNPVPGHVSLVYAKNPSYFQAAMIGNQDTKTLVIKNDSEKIIAFQTTATRRVYCNGRAVTIGYLSNLRMDKNYKGKGLLKEGFEFLKQVHSQIKVPFYFSTIISGNNSAANTLTRHRDGGLHFIDYGNYLTKAIIIFNKKYKLSNDYRIIRGNKDNLPEIVNFLNSEGGEKNLFPCYTENDFTEKNILKDFNINDFYLAIKNNVLAGVIGKWDQSSFKQNSIDSYNGAYSILHPVYNILANTLNLPRMPKRGEQIQFIYTCFIAIKENDPKIFLDLLKAVYNDLAGSNNLFLMVGLHEKDGLRESLKKFIGLAYKSNLFINYWEKPDGFNIGRDTNIPYLELATL